METSIKINCENSTYIDKSHTNSNYSNDDNLITGLIKTKDSKINICISILNFSTINLDYSNINHAYLYIFLEDIKTVKNKPANLNIIGNFDYIDISRINWSNFPENVSSNGISLEIPISEKNSYIKIDVTDIINYLAQFDINYNLLISPVAPYASTFVKFSSCNSNNPPYLILEKLKNHSSIASDKNTYNKKPENYGNDDNIDSIYNFDIEDNKDMSKNINFYDTKNNTDDHFNIDFDYETNINKNFLDNNDFNKIIKKIDDFSNTLINESSNIINIINNKEEIIDNKISSYKYIIEDLSNTIKTINNKIDLLNNSILLSSNTLNDLYNITKNSNKKTNILDNDILSSGKIINDLSNIIKGMNNKTDNDNFKKDFDTSDDKLTKLFDNINKNTSILDLGNILPMFNTIKDTFSNLKAQSTAMDNKIDDSHDTDENISFKIADNLNFSDIKTDTSFQELSNSLLNVLNKNLSLLNKEINNNKNNDSNNED